jgi:hypothetical protein
VNKRVTPQNEPARDDQVRNNAGGFVFAVDKWARLDRFLILGAEGGTYYVGERELTDCAQPMIYALENKLEVDCFSIYTDNETWSGSVHPFQALRAYRERMGIPAKLVVVGMVSTGFTIADPSDAGMLDVVGFDSAAPAIIADFAANREVLS